MIVSRALTEGKMHLSFETWDQRITIAEKSSLYFYTLQGLVRKKNLWTRMSPISMTKLFFWHLMYNLIFGAHSWAGISKLFWLQAPVPVAVRMNCINCLLWLSHCTGFDAILRQTGLSSNVFQCISMYQRSCGQGWWIWWYIETSRLVFKCNSMYFSLVFRWISMDFNVSKVMRSRVMDLMQ